MGTKPPSRAPNGNLSPLLIWSESLCTRDFHGCGGWMFLFCRHWLPCVLFRQMVETLLGMVGAWQEQRKTASDWSVSLVIVVRWAATTYAVEICLYTSLVYGSRFQSSPSHILRFASNVTILHIEETLTYCVARLSWCPCCTNLQRPVRNRLAFSSRFKSNAMQKSISICHLRCLVLHALGHPCASALDAFGRSLFQDVDMFEALGSTCCVYSHSLLALRLSPDLDKQLKRCFCDLALCTNGTSTAGHRCQ